MAPLGAMKVSGHNRKMTAFNGTNEAPSRTPPPPPPVYDISLIRHATCSGLQKLPL